MRREVRAIFLVLVIWTMVMQAAVAEQVSMIVGRIMVNGQPQDNAVVSGFGSTDRTGQDGQYVLKFESAGAGVINATYDGYHVSSGLIVIPSSPLIRVKDLDIVVPDDAAGTGPGNTDSPDTLKPWTHIPLPIGSADAARVTARPPDVSETVLPITGALCAALLCFLIYVAVRK